MAIGSPSARRSLPDVASRRWFQFRLRTLLIAVAVLAVPCAWAGYSLRWIEKRHAVLERPPIPNVYNYVRYDNFEPPGLLWLFGEKGVATIMCERRYPKERAENRRLFPEAYIVDVVLDDEP